MDISIKLVQFFRKGDDGSKKRAVYLRIYRNGEKKYFNTQIYVTPRYWSKTKNKVLSTHPKHIIYNEELTRIENRAEEKIFELRRDGKLSIENLLAYLESGEREGVLEYGEEYLEYLRDADKYWAQRKFKVVKNDLAHFLKEICGRDIPLPLDELDLGKIEEFQQYLLSDLKRGKPNSNSTVRRKMTRLKAMVDHARKNGVISHNPFEDYERVPESTGAKVSLTPAQIGHIKELDLEPGGELWHVRNYFMYSFYNAGIRFGDLCSLRWSNIRDGRLRYKMQKTGNQKSINQLAPMNKILSHYKGDKYSETNYIFPILERDYADGQELRRAIGSKNAMVNRALKEIAGMADIQSNVSFHVSRHSYAHAALKAENDLYQISKALGHSKISTTEGYLKSFDEEHLDEGMSQFIDSLD